MSLLALVAVSALAAAARASPGYLSYKDFSGGGAYAVTADNRSISLNGQRTLFHSAGIHYPRFTPGQWDDVLLKARNDGYNMIQTYFFVNAHQPKATVWPWIMDGPANLRLFLDKCAAAGFFVNLRIGPYVCAEWSWGGYPYDLAQTPGIGTRSSEPQWEQWMSTLMLNVTREFRSYFADRGGPIVLAQVENELHTNDAAYIDFCGELTVRTGVQIPWLMCNGVSAANTINSCNGGDCTSFIEEHGQNGKVLVTQPALWTENWMGWFASWGDNGPAGNWPAFDATSQSSGKAAGLLRWFARGGSHVNQYNWAGGNEFARNAGSSMVNTYYWDAPIASDNLDQGPERRHIARTNAAIAAVAAELLASPAQLHQQVLVPFTNASGAHPGDTLHIGFVYGGGAVAFLENHGAGLAHMQWGSGGCVFSVAGGASVLVRSNCSVLANSSAVESTGLTHGWAPVPGAALQWSSWADPLVPAAPDAVPTPTAPRQRWVGSALGAVISSPTPLEAVAFGEYDSELTLYVTVLTAADLARAVAASPNASAVTLSIESAVAQAWQVFANGALCGRGYELSHADGSKRINVTVDLSGAPAGAAVALSLLSISLGIGNGGGVHGNVSTGVKGVTSAKPGAVVLGGVDLTAAAAWTHVAGSVGEAARVFTPTGGAGVTWTPGVGRAPLTWLRATFTAPAAALAPPPGVEATATLNIDVSGLSRGRLYVNGFDLGRYWSRLCGAKCMCQRFYPVPFDILLPGADANTLVVLDEEGVTSAAPAAGLALSTYVPSSPAPPLPC